MAWSGIRRSPGRIIALPGITPKLRAEMPRISERKKGVLLKLEEAKQSGRLKATDEAVEEG